MTNLHLDIETYSEADLVKVGTYRYAYDPSFEILLLSFSFDGQKVRCIDLAQGEKLPPELEQALLSNQVTKWAHNANFERVCLSRHFGRVLDPSSWRCTMVLAAEQGLPTSLVYVAQYLELGQQKDTAGKALISKFCKPYRGKRVLPSDDPTAWGKFKEYCNQDVRTEMDIHNNLESIPDSEWALYEADQRINDLGIVVDLELIKAAVHKDTQNCLAGVDKMRSLTRLENPTSVAQLSAWVRFQGVKLPNLLADTVNEAIENPDLPENVRQVLQLRASTSNSSLKKLQVMLDTQVDGRIRGLLQFYGAARTGRWSGRLVQIHNLPRGEKPPEELDMLASKIKQGFEVASQDIKELIRPCFIPEPNKEFIVSDFSAIEARVLAWLAGETWALRAFERGEDIYKVTAAQMFHITTDQVTKEQRGRGKVAVLACGYQGGVGALTAMGADNLGLSNQDKQHIIDAWRQANPNILRFWGYVENTAKAALVNAGKAQKLGGLEFLLDNHTLYITLPSGRRLAYSKARLVGREIKYMGQGNSPWFVEQATYGGKLTENITQAVARDILGEAILNLQVLGYDVVAHVHDEVIVEAPIGTVTVDEINSIMVLGAPWCQGLPLSAAGFKSRYYRKD